MIFLLTLMTLTKGIELYLVPHSHCDPGWLQTLEGYYYTKVQHILSNIISLMHEHQTMTMVWSETVFLSM